MRDKGWNQKTLAARAGVSEPSITRLLDGRSISIGVGKSVADALQMKMRHATYADIPNPITRKAVSSLVKSARIYPRRAK